MGEKPFVIMNDDRTKYRCWTGLAFDWTEDPDQALQFYRQRDAHDVAGEDAENVVIVELQPDEKVVKVITYEALRDALSVDIHGPSWRGLKPDEKKNIASLMRVVQGHFAMLKPAAYAVVYGDRSWELVKAEDLAAAGDDPRKPLNVLPLHHLAKPRG